MTRKFKDEYDYDGITGREEEVDNMYIHLDTAEPIRIFQSLKYLIMLNRIEETIKALPIPRDQREQLHNSLKELTAVAHFDAFIQGAADVICCRGLVGNRKKINAALRDLLNPQTVTPGKEC